MARGPDDFVLRLVARNTAHENELTQRLTSAPYVVTVKTIQVIRTAKSKPGVPIDIAQGVEPASQEYPGRHRTASRPRRGCYHCKAQNERTARDTERVGC